MIQTPKRFNCLENDRPELKARGKMKENKKRFLKRENDLPVAVRGGGHHVAGFALKRHRCKLHR
ncbi:uncharacterized protein Dvar_52040 [Desulfosarcina variabilis str. Montpellier]